MKMWRSSLAVMTGIGAVLAPLPREPRPAELAGAHDSVAVAEGTRILSAYKLISIDVKNHVSMANCQISPERGGF